MKTKRIIAAVITATLMLLNLAGALPALAQSRTEVRYATPAGYDDHDYQAMVAFMETADAQGVKNGTTISWLCGLQYDPTDPATWGEIEIDDEFFTVFRGVIWTNEPVKHLRGIWIEVDGELDKTLCGELDVSNCVALQNCAISDADHISRIDVTGCSSMKYYSVWNAGLTSVLDFSGCTSMLEIGCNDSGIERLDIADCALLEQIQCTNTSITEIDLSNCPNLTVLNLADNELTSLDVSNCTNIEWMFCDRNNISELSVAGLSKMWELRCNDNCIASLNFTGCTELRNLYCQNNCLTELDFTGVPYPYFKTVRTEGSGFVGYKCGDYVGWDRAVAEPKPGAEFLGWYAEDGSLISTETELLKNATDKTSVTAKFTVVASLPGDINGDGALNANDALLIMRYSLGTEQLTPEQNAAADVNGDGTVNSIDALLILRAALGLSEI